MALNAALYDNYTGSYLVNSKYKIWAIDWLVRHRCLFSLKAVNRLESEVHFEFTTHFWRQNPVNNLLILTVWAKQRREDQTCEHILYKVQFVIVVIDLKHHFTTVPASGCCRIKKSFLYTWIKKYICREKWGWHFFLTVQYSLHLSTAQVHHDFIGLCQHEHLELEFVSLDLETFSPTWARLRSLHFLTLEMMKLFQRGLFYFYDTCWCMWTCIVRMGQCICV